MIPATTDDDSLRQDIEAPAAGRAASCRRCYSANDEAGKRKHHSFARCLRVTPVRRHNARYRHNKCARKSAHAQAKYMIRCAA